MKQAIKASEAAELVRDGSTVLIGGFMGVGSPHRLINALVARGQAFGQSRVICGVHWQSDVTQGRIIGAATVARLHADPVFRAQFDAARQELAVVRAKGLKPAGDCAAEAAALKP